MAFVHPVTVRWGDCDPAGIAYFPVVFDWFHQAMEAWFGDMGHPYADVITRRGIGLPCVHTEADFARPCAFGDSLEIHLSVSRLGTSSVHLAYAVEPGRATGRSVVSVVDLQTMTAVEIPADLRQAMTAYSSSSPYSG